MCARYLCDALHLYYIRCIISLKKSSRRRSSKSDEKNKKIKGKTGSLGFSCILKNINNRLVSIIRYICTYAAGPAVAVPMEIRGWKSPRSRCSRLGECSACTRVLRTICVIIIIIWRYNVERNFFSIFILFYFALSYHTEFFFLS